MSKILVTDKEIVVPGQVLAEGMGFLPAGAAFRDKDRIIALKIGLVNIDGRLIKLIPLKGQYLPKIHDLVIGKIEDVMLGSWLVDYGGSKYAMLSARNFLQRNNQVDDLSQFMDVGDVIIAKIYKVVRKNTVDLSMQGPGLRKLGNGRVIEVSPPKVPRIIGKQGSMISMIKDQTNCRISVGQNGWVWVYGPDPNMEMIAIETIRKIENESHIPGLTDRIKDFLNSKVGKVDKVVKIDRVDEEGKEDV